MAELGWPYYFQWRTILVSRSAEIGTERTLPLLVPLKVITPLRSPVGFSFSASDQRAPVAKQISVMISTCGLSQPLRMVSSSSAICSVVSQESSRS